jgi:hypothetical protein
MNARGANERLFKMKATMDNKPVDDVSLPPLATWPLPLNADASARCRNNQVILAAPTKAFCLIEKMMMSNVLSHTAAVYRFEKIRPCKRVQRWWRKRRVVVHAPSPPKLHKTSRLGCS